VRFRKLFELFDNFIAQDINKMLVNHSIVSAFETTVGEGTTRISTQPMYHYYDYGYFGNIYTAAELGVGAPVWITGIRYYMRNTSTSTYTSNNQTMKIGYCNKPEFLTNVRNTFQQVPLDGANPFTSHGITAVKTNFSWVIASEDKWYELLLDTPFQYNPTSGNLLIIWENRDDSWISGTSSNPTSSCSTNGTNRSYYDYQDNSMLWLNIMTFNLELFNQLELFQQTIAAQDLQGDSLSFFSIDLGVFGE
jgi:hypothetical protein